MDESESTFCMACGAELPAGVAFCPKCGAATGTPTQTYSAPRPASGPTVTLPLILTGLYAVIAVLSGLAVMGAVDIIVGILRENTINAGVDWIYYLASMGFSSEAQFASYMFNNGLITLVSGVLVAVSCGLCATARYNTIAMASCVAGSLVLLAVVAITPSVAISSALISAIVEVAIGCLVAYMIYRARDAFQD